jgi:hypothetical protein
MRGEVSQCLSWSYGACNKHQQARGGGHAKPFMFLRLGTLKIEFGARAPACWCYPNPDPLDVSGTSMVIFTHTTFPLPTHAAHAHAFDPQTAQCAHTYMVKAQRTETEGVGGCELLVTGCELPGRRPDAETARTHAP